MDELWQETTMGAELETSVSENVTVVEVEHWCEVLHTGNTVTMIFTTICFMLAMGAAISVMELWTHIKRPVGAVIGMMGQFAVLPAVGFCLSLGFKLRPYEALGVLIISCSPAGALSNFFTYWVDGDLALSIMMTAYSSLLAFGGMPFNLWLYGSYWQKDKSFVIPFGNIITSLVFVTVPVIVGMTVRHFHKRAANIITRVSSLVGWVGVIAACVILTVLYWETFVMASSMLYLAAVLLGPIGFTLAFLSAKLACQNNKIGRTIGIETSCQNVPVAFSIILLSFEESDIKGDILMFPMLYTFFLISEAIVSISAYQLSKRFSKKDKDYPAMHTARLDPATPDEEETIRL